MGFIYFYTSSGGDNGSYVKNDVVVEDVQQLPQAQKLVEQKVDTKKWELYDGQDPFQDYRSLPKKDWEDHTRVQADAQRSGPGEQSVPISIPNESEDSKNNRKKIFLENGFDAVYSDMISLDRAVRDLRHHQCKDLKYVNKQPTVSVIVPYHNEHNTTLLRTVHSILNKSPKDVLHEIILVDDDSDREYLLAPLDKYLKDRGLDKLVKVVRPGKRHGLIRARQIGAQHATGEILVFLDSHSEAMPNWIPPLVEPIVLDYKTVVCPFIDVIDCNNFDIRPQDQGMRGSFAWNFDYKRLPLRPKDQKVPTDPFDSPVMAGGYFAISAKWFWELGGYDEKLDIWGGEQYELSFKVWQCHGRMVDAPCSRVGHIYRCKRHGEATPFGFGDYLSRNYRRVAEVWMDEYKQHLFKRRPGIANAEPGDMTKMKGIRDKLQCKSFDWFMKNVADDQDFYYPAVEPEPSANGTVKNIGNGKCLDAKFHNDGEGVVIGDCGFGEQSWKLTNYLDLRTSEKCLDIPKNQEKAPVVIYHCHMGKGNQMFRYLPATKQIKHPVTGLCLDSDASKSEVFASSCDTTVLTQKWQFENLNTRLLKERYEKDKDL
ncbi:unnamed protein product [Bursaphelenchus okinawaensis]|uniref:Polypeptide N-acetylgalactosaminyltransferase n=1 Tax=Bursaphelenchus okinawaensis TaxID=465554 RepID=A0A811KRI5_9BILA|nr:unnamed protein product [Bursaphelenchus okinawaensis]CAG9109968.1 unnamed protein product [Bursaphelenchus okinawaensis]